jgi:lactate dehydrogenase-like 2-hydroxyacid dehydrogenase
MRKKKLMISFWLPSEVLNALDGDVEVLYPQEETTGFFSMEEIRKRLPEMDGVLILGEVFDRSVIDLGEKLEVIARCGVGCDNIDCKYAGEKGIAVVNTPEAVTRPTAELTVAIMLAVCRGIVRLDKKTRRDKACVLPPIFDDGAVRLSGSTLGIIGFGRIGRTVAHSAHGLGMKIVYADPAAASPEVERAVSAERVSIEELLKTSDFVSLHCPYTPENHHLIDEKALALMKPSSYLINASRGKMVKETALAEALKNDVIKGAALDVYEFEPQICPQLLELDNVVLVPHIGTYTYSTRIEMAREALFGVGAVLRGEIPSNIFNREYLVLQGDGGN